MSFLVVYQKCFNITFYSFISIKSVSRFMLFAVLVILFLYYFILLNINLMILIYFALACFYCQRRFVCLLLFLTNLFCSFRWSRSGAFLCFIFLSFISTLLFMLPVFISPFYSFPVITL